LEQDKERRKEVGKERKANSIIKRYRNQIRNGNCPDNCMAIESIRDDMEIVNLYWLFIENQSIDKSYYENKVISIHFTITEKLDGIILGITNKSKEIKGVRWDDCTLNGYKIKIDGISEEELINEDLLTPGQKIQRIIRVGSSRGINSSMARLIKNSIGDISTNIILKIKLVYFDNITEFIRLELKTKHIMERFMFVDKRPINYVGKEMFPDNVENGWITYVTKNNVRFDKGQAYVVNRINDGIAFLKEIKDVPKGTPVILKSGGKKYGIIFEEPSLRNYSNRLKTSDDSTGDGVYVLANKLKGVGFYKWTGGILGAGNVYLPSDVKSIDDFVGIEY
jgi:hypothetical protein